MLKQAGPRRFGADRLARIAQLEGWHFWFVGRQALIDRLLRRYLAEQSGIVLDLGCGTGVMLSRLLLGGQRAVGLDLLKEGLEAARAATPEALLVQAEATHLPFDGRVCAGVLMLDVMEHVDDQVLLSEVQRVLRPDGWAIITVPAMPWLWSYRDKEAGHLRRYRRRDLIAKLSAAGLQVQEVRYYQCLLFPVVALTRLLGREGPMLRDREEQPLGLLNTVFSGINFVEARLSDVIAWPWGSSLVAVCRKK